MAEMTLADHAEAWQRERGEIVPARELSAWAAMYEQWIEFAFSTFAEADYPERCNHPPARLYAWFAQDGTHCVTCCDCGRVLTGAA